MFFSHILRNDVSSYDKQLIKIISLELELDLILTQSVQITCKRALKVESVFAVIILDAIILSVIKV